MYDADVRVAPVQGMLFCFAVTAGLAAQLPGMPHGMYCGGNEMRFEGNLSGSAVAGVVLDPTGAEIPRARVQAQIQGRDETLKDFTTDESGRFRLRGLRTGQYWLGISRAGFNLHYSRLTVSRRFGEAKVRAALSVGT
jgi:hypothetical protein